MAQTSFAHYLDILRPNIPVELVPDVSFSKIRELADRIPGALAFSAFGFECPLGVQDAEADFLFSLTKDNSGPDILSGKLPECDFDEALLSLPQWKQVRSFGGYWANPPSPLYRGMDDVWLEFDVSRPSAEAVMVPSLFLSPFIKHEDSGKFALGEDGPLRLLGNVFFWLRGRKPRNPALQNWKRCLSMLPSPKSLFQMGVMLPRSNSDTLRICLLAPDPTIIEQYLFHIHWPGDFSKLEPVLKKLSTIFEMLYLHLDVGDGISGKIGIECKFPKRKDPSREPRWFGFLNYLEDEGLCLLSRRNGLLAFPGYQKTDMDRAPEPLRELSQKLYLLYHSYFVRTIYHIKLVYHENEAWEAKGYFGINHLWKGVSGDHRKGRGIWGIIG